LIDVGNPSGDAVDVDVRFGHVPFIAFPSGILGFDEGHDRVPVESDFSIADVNIRCDDGVELRNIVRERRSEYRSCLVPGANVPTQSTHGFSPKNNGLQLGTAI
jgi:hypothetical protein